MHEVAGVPKSYNPRLTMRNPDPEWIPGWENLKWANDTKIALVQAKANKSWLAKIDSEYKRFQSEWKALDARYRPQLEKIVASKDGYYAKRTALAELWKSIKGYAADRKIWYGPGYPSYTVCLLADVVLAMVDLHRSSGTEVVVHRYLKAQDINLVDFSTHARKSGDAAFERDLFVATALRHGTAGTGPLAVMFNARGTKQIRWPITQEQAKEMDAKRATMATSYRKRYKVYLPERFAQPLSDGGPPPDDKDAVVHM